MTMISIHHPTPYGLTCQKEVEITDMAGACNSVSVNLADFIENICANETISELLIERILSNPTAEQLASLIRKHRHPIEVDRIKEALA